MRYRQLSITAALLALLVPGLAGCHILFPAVKKDGANAAQSFGAFGHGVAADLKNFKRPDTLSDEQRQRRAE